jgi:hypothetical protein
VRDLLRGMGHDSELYALTIDDELKDDVRPFADAGAKRGDLTIFHYALPSSMTAAFASLDRGRVLQYHNVTPAAYFAPYDPSLFRLASLGRQELTTLVGHCDLALGDSSSTRSASSGRASSRSPWTPRASRSPRGVPRSSRRWTMAS